MLHYMLSALSDDEVKEHDKQANPDEELENMLALHKCFDRHILYGKVIKRCP